MWRDITDGFHAVKARFDKEAFQKLEECVQLFVRVGRDRPEVHSDHEVSQPGARPLLALVSFRSQFSAPSNPEGKDERQFYCIIVVHKVEFLAQRDHLPPRNLIKVDDELQSLMCVLP